jgi:hypothetical protein
MKKKTQQHIVTTAFANPFLNLKTDQYDIITFYKELEKRHT